MIDYKKLKISDTNRIKEQQIIDQIGQCIDDGFSWIFNAGAGSGKTYALVQSLKMLLDKKRTAVLYPWAKSFMYNIHQCCCR